MIDWRRLIPTYWFQNYETDWYWDSVLNEIIDNAKTVTLKYYGIDIDGIEIWTQNWPYAYGSLLYNWGNNRNYVRLPSVKTRLRLRDFVRSHERMELKEIIRSLKDGS